MIDTKRQRYFLIHHLVPQGADNVGRAVLGVDIGSNEGLVKVHIGRFAPFRYQEFDNPHNGGICPLDAM